MELSVTDEPPPEKPPAEEPSAPEEHPPPPPVIHPPAGWTRIADDPVSFGPWGDLPCAVVGWADTVSFIRDPGEASDAQLRSLVNAPVYARVVRIPAKVLPPDWLAWHRCMICGTERDDARISVRHRPIVGLEQVPGCQANVLYCNDRLFCVVTANVDESWPPERMLPPQVYPEDELYLSAAAADDRSWLKDSSLGMLGVGILTWLRDEPATAQEIIAAYDEPAQQVLDMCRVLVGRGLIMAVRERLPD